MKTVLTTVFVLLIATLATGEPKHIEPTTKPATITDILASVDREVLELKGKPNPAQLEESNKQVKAMIGKPADFRIKITSISKLSDKENANLDIAKGEGRDWLVRMSNAKFSYGGGFVYFSPYILYSNHDTQLVATYKVDQTIQAAGQITAIKFISEMNHLKLVVEITPHRETDPEMDK